MNKIIGITFTYIYILVFGFIVFMVNALTSISDLMILLAIGYLVVALIALWSIYFFVKRRNFKGSTIIFFLSGLGIGLLLIDTFFASGRLANNRDRYLNETPIARVFNMKNEILFSQMGNPIGIRLNYQMSFPYDKYNYNGNYIFHGFASMSPKKDFGVGMWTAMHRVNQNIEPPMIGTNPPEYEQGKIYNFTVDMIPIFLIPNVDKTKPLCIAKMPKEYADAFQKLIQNNEAVRFSIEVFNTKYRGVTANTYSFKEFYDSAIKEGLLECKGRIMYR